MRHPLPSSRAHGTLSHVLTRAIARVQGLLVLSSVVTAQAGQAGPALLALLQALATAAEGPRVLDAYGTYYRSLLASARPDASEGTFEEYIIGAVLDGANAYGAACSSGDEVRRAALKGAVLADLDALQRLCVSGRTAAEWAQSQAGPTGRPEGWLDAAAAPVPPPSNASSARVADAKSGDARAAVTPASASERAAFCVSMSQRWRWSEAEPDLKAFYERHGTGVLARSPVGAWDTKAKAVVDATRREQALWQSETEEAALDSAGGTLAAAFDALVSDAEGRTRLLVATGPGAMESIRSAAAAAYSRHGIVTCLVEPSASARTTLADLGAEIDSVPGRRVCVVYGTCGLGDNPNARALADAVAESGALRGALVLVASDTDADDVSPLVTAASEFVP